MSKAKINLCANIIIFTEKTDIKGKKTYFFDYFCM